mmetsp:Transcript_18614/g.17942  ORF Transcript_18614/g.17942 Transcript_18614/m.17942 type:complete len:335 (-) Transcript_18614:446-1450(-)
MSIDEDVKEEKGYIENLHSNGNKNNEAFRKKDIILISEEEYFEHPNESSMRLATDSSKEDRCSIRKRSRTKIKERRGAFKFLPVYFSNDLVHGSWWFVLGSALMTIIPIVPLVNLFYPFWRTKTNMNLPMLADVTTFALLIASGFFFTIGSLAFVRATEEPPLRPLFSKITVHLETDELLAAWLFLIATLPFPLYMAVLIYHDHQQYVYWGCLVASIFFVIATYLFVLTCYPCNGERNYQIAPYLSTLFFGEFSWMNKHLCNDWLASTWFFFFATFIMVLGALGMLFVAVFGGGNELEIFDWASAFVDCMIFLIGSAYFCAGKIMFNTIKISQA